MIKVWHNQTGKEYYLISAGFGMYQSSVPDPIFGNLSPNTEEGTLAMVAVCDETGVIKWFNSKTLRVTEIDGHVLSGIEQGRRVFSCPACGSVVNETDRQCPSCDIRFIDG